MQKTRIISGLWKFHERVPEQQLVEIAEEWAKEPKYTQLYVRKGSKDQYGIGFMYDLREEEISENEYSDFFNNVSDKLKRRFGNDFVGWDVSQYTTIIK